MDRLPAPVDRSIGPALRELLDASPKAVRRALQDRRGAEGLDGGKRAKKEETRRLVSSLDALARFLTDFSALESSGDPATAHPVLDPLLERVVRPTAGRGSGASVARSSDRSTDEKKTALRLVAFLASPDARTSLGERREDANDALRRATAVGQALARRCAPGPTERRARLAACVAVKPAAVHCRALPAASAGAADALRRFASRATRLERTRPRGWRLPGGRRARRDRAHRHRRRGRRRRRRPTRRRKPRASVARSAGGGAPVPPRSQRPRRRWTRSCVRSTPSRCGPRARRGRRTTPASSSAAVGWRARGETGRRSSRRTASWP